MLKLSPWRKYITGLICPDRRPMLSYVLCSYLHEALSPFSPQAMLLAPFQLHPPVLEPSLHLVGEGRAEKTSAKEREEQMLSESQAGRSRGRVTRWHRYIGQQQIKALKSSLGLLPRDDCLAASAGGQCICMVGGGGGNMSTGQL